MEEQTSAISELEEFISLNICFQVNDDYNQEQFDVVPM
jgi:Ribonuclease G/E